ncbi:hypothetical protein KUTeg_006637 [Tegillarca granosa]|uniref:Uncharacterized protein n=1 Tax=Tegillarca granosa TaxID=220873 RepID=A0ABQ9FF56_TEGGR|nr:hypothetical protein KUTeg_011376 [Tegillarca granosa]KAJ8314487.1 hypothetical protein KUTeg_006637 [Tegillarca granosa]
MENHFALIEHERKFRRACEQILQLNFKMDVLQDRYIKAKKNNNRSFRYSLRLRLAVVESMRNVYYEYAHKQAIVVADMRSKLFGEIVEIVDQDMVTMHDQDTE